MTYYVMGLILSGRLWQRAGITYALVARISISSSNGYLIVSESVRTMGRTIEVGIPSKNGTLHGLLHPAPAARAGVILIGEPGGGLRGPADIYDELALYLRASGFTTLQMEHLHPNSLVNCTYDILAALSSLHTWGVERAVLVIWSSAEPDTTKMNGTRNISMDGAAVSRVVDAIIGLVGVVVGVATIVAPPNHRSRARRSGRPPRLRLIRGTRGDTSAASPLPVPPPRSPASSVLTVREDTPHRLTLSLQDEADHSHYASALITKLYAWSRLMLQEAMTESVQEPIPLQRRRGMPAHVLNGSRVDERPKRDSIRGRARGRPFNTARIWLDQQWENILTGLDTRDPARAIQARSLAQSLPEAVQSHSMGTVGHVWPLLDFEARADWLQACSMLHYYISDLVYAAPRHAVGDTAATGSNA